MIAPRASVCVSLTTSIVGLTGGALAAGKIRLAQSSTVTNCMVSCNNTYARCNRHAATPLKRSAQLHDATDFLPDELRANFAVALSLAEIGDRFGDRFDRLFGRGAADRNGFRGAMEIEPADMADARSDMNIRRIAREPHPGEAVLHDVKGFHHHRGKAWAAVAGNDLPLERAFGTEYSA